MTTKLTVMLGFVIAFSAGLFTGLNSRPVAPAVNQTHGPNPPTTREGRGRGDRDRESLVARELGLSNEQREQMREIWSSMAIRGGRELGEIRRQYREERDDAIADLIRLHDLKAYDAILREYQDKLTRLDQEYSAAWQAAVERTKQILTPEQRTKYEEFLKRSESWDRGRRGGGPRGNDDDRRPGDRAASRPADK